MFRDHEPLSGKEEDRNLNTQHNSTSLTDSASSSQTLLAGNAHTASLIPTSADERQPPQPLHGGSNPIPGAIMRQRTVRYARKELIKTRYYWKRAGKRKIGVLASLRHIITYSCLNVLLVVVPFSWAAHFSNKKYEEEYFPYWVTFLLSFISIMPLVKLAEYGGEQLSYYLSPNTGDMFIVSIHNAVEGALGLVLLAKCELRLLQSTIIGVILLRLLLIPGIAFIVGGARIRHQHIESRFLELNRSLLIIGVLAMILPVAFVAALRTTTVTENNEKISILDDEMRGLLLQNSRGLAVILLTIYIASSIHMHRPPADVEDGSDAKVVRQSTVRRHRRQSSYPSEDQEEDDPELNPWVAIGLLVIVLGLMVVTVEWLVSSVEHVRENKWIRLEMFGLIYLPIISFSADAAVTLIYFLRRSLKSIFGAPSPPDLLASARGIDLSIQFTLAWTPIFVIVGWITHKPLGLYFDIFEVAALLIACFIVSHITADNKTNWAEGYAMVALYIIIALFAFNYPGQSQLQWVDVCNSIAETLKAVESGETTIES